MPEKLPDFTLPFPPVAEKLPGCAAIQELFFCAADDDDEDCKEHTKGDYFQPPRPPPRNSSLMLKPPPDKQHANRARQNMARSTMGLVRFSYLPQPFVLTVLLMALTVKNMFLLGE